MVFGIGSIPWLTSPKYKAVAKFRIVDTEATLPSGIVGRGRILDSERLRKIS